jgi:hypothetical protein
MVQRFFNSSRYSFAPTESVVLLSYRGLLIKATWRSGSIDRLGPLAFRVILVMWRTNACLTQRSISLLIGWYSNHDLGKLGWNRASSVKPFGCGQTRGNMLGDCVLLSSRNNIESKVVKLMTQLICEMLSCSNRNTNTANLPNESTRYTDGDVVARRISDTLGKKIDQLLVK